jgi:hypothetical protein
METESSSNAAIEPDDESWRVNSLHSDKVGQSREKDSQRIRSIHCQSQLLESRAGKSCDALAIPDAWDAAKTAPP